MDITELNSVIAGILRVECNGVECCPHQDDSGWTSNPESDMTS